MGNSALCGDCCVDCCPWLLKKRTRFTVIVFGYTESGKTCFVRKAVRMGGGAVESVGNNTASFTVETLDVGERTRLEFFDVDGDKDSRVLWPTYFNFGVHGMIYILDGTADDEVIEENIKQLISLIQHDAIVKPRNGGNSSSNRSVSGDAFHSIDGAISNDSSANEKNRRTGESSLDGSGNFTITGSPGSQVYDTPVAIVINKGDKFLLHATKDHQKLIGGNSDSNNRSGKFASALCSKFSLQDRILTAVRAKIASTLFTPKRILPSCGGATSDGNAPPGSGGGSEERSPSGGGSNNNNNNNSTPALSATSSISHHHFHDDHHHHQRHLHTKTTPSTKPAKNLAQDQEMEEKKSIVGSLTSSSSDGELQNSAGANGPCSCEIRSPQIPKKIIRDSVEPIPPPLQLPSVASSTASAINSSSLASAAVAEAEAGSLGEMQEPSAAANDVATRHKATSSELPSGDAIPFDAKVNCAGFRWQVFEVSAVNGENVLNVVNWMTNAMLRGKKP